MISVCAYNGNISYNDINLCKKIIMSNREYYC